MLPTVTGFRTKVMHVPLLQRSMHSLKMRKQAIQVGTLRLKNPKNIHCIIEVHDARIPCTGRSMAVQELLTDSGNIPHILVLNKEDLIDERLHADVREYLRVSEGIANVVFTNSLHSKRDVRGIVPLARELMLRNARAKHQSVTHGFNVLVAGLPRVGKHAILNCINSNHLYRNDRRYEHINELIANNKIILNEQPLIYTESQPLIVQPVLQNIKSVFKLSLVGCRLNCQKITDEMMAEYLLNCLNKRNCFDYVELMGLQQPSVNIKQVLSAYCHKNRLFGTTKLRDGGVVQCPNFARAAAIMIALFREGKLGKIVLDRC